jgi:KDO2-lipid IV(A) lauroyltransferase
LFHVIGYRRQVVFDNLKNSFPEKSDKEIKLLTKKFYHYFCDLTLETFKTLTISKKAMLRHCSLDPAAEVLFRRLADEKQNLIIVMGHQGNWEWAGNTFSICCQHQLYVIYHPLSNKHFNGLICGMRHRFGTRLIAMTDTFREMIRNKNHLNATAFIADQSPQPDKAHWMNFLNQDTPVFMGTEKIAQKVKYPIVYVSVKKLSRGYYTLMADLLQTPPYAALEGEITERHSRKLEADIIAQPETWLWTHRRWKHKRFQDDGKNSTFIP